jgi:hypothetical protein
MKNLYRVTCYTPYCGTDTTYWVFADHEGDIPEETLNEWVMENAEGYEYLVTGWDEDFETEEEREDYYADCGYDISGPYELDEAVEEGYNGFADAEF